MKVAVFDHPLQARIAAMIMTFWGIVVRFNGKTVTLADERAGKGGFEFFVNLYDGRKQ